MLAALSSRMRPFNLQATLDGWDTSSTKHLVPKFKGKPKRKDDPSPESWLDSVARGCKARHVPKKHWSDVATSEKFMAKKPRGRVTEVEKVMHVLHGQDWVWTWKKFRNAVLNMGWNIDESKTCEVNVERKDDSDFWRIVTGKLSKFLGSAPEPEIIPKGKAAQKDEKDVGARPNASRSSSLFSLPSLPFRRPTAPQPEPTLLNRISAHVPVWLIDMSKKLATFVKENPDVLTAIVVLLVAAGILVGGGSAPIAMIGAAVVRIVRALKTAYDNRVQCGSQDHGHPHGSHKRLLSSS